MQDYRLYQAVLEQLPVGVIVVNTEGMIVLANATAARVRHRAVEDMVGQHVVQCHPEQSHHRVERALGYLQREETSQFTRMVTDHEQQRYYENTYAAIRDAQRGYLGAVVVTQDITDRRSLEEERLAHQLALEARIAELTTQLEQIFLASLTSLINVLEAKDAYTMGHSLRVHDIATRLGEYGLGFGPEMSDIALAATLHDIGKVGVRETILHKPARLTPDEYAHIQAHPLIGERILQPLGHLDMVRLLVRHHHERYDGQGYPDGLAGNAIPEGARVLAIADSFDAMISDRPYRDAMHPEQAAQIIREQAGTQFDPIWSERFLELFESGSLG